LPIPAFHGEDGQVLLTAASVKAVATFVRDHGSDAWFTEDAAAILSHYEPGDDPDAPATIREAGKAGFAALTKGTDIFDVWFESGSSWNAVMREREIGFPCDLYLEGSDQHRGWFQTSMLPALGMMGSSPYREVLTHGFMVTAQGQKMSKSLGNAIEVEDLLKQHGADICRWWTASLNYTYDVKVDWEFFRVASDEYRKVRNTIRFMLGNLADFDPEKDRYQFADEDALTVDGWAMAKLSELVSTVREGYVTFRFKRVVEALFDFCNDTMSAVYLAAVKDRLYCDAREGPRRRRTQTVLYDTVHALIRMLAPILVHTADEAWAALNGDDGSEELCIHLELLPAPFQWTADGRWDEVMALRGEVLKQLELAKEDPGISNPMDAGVEVVTSQDQLATLQPFLADLVDLVGVSRFNVDAGDEASIVIRDVRDEPRCERSWKRDGTVRERSDGGLLSDRDAAVVGVE
jgi:isoleucyl-tRNA synthetase